MVIIDNLLEESYLKELQNLVLSYNFPWYILPNTTDSMQMSGVTTKNTRESQFFSHGLYGSGVINSSFYHYFEPIVGIIETRVGETYILERLKLNLMIKDKDFPDSCYNTPHSDVGITQMTGNYKTVLFYLNKTDGDTFFFDRDLKDTAFNKSVELNVSHRQPPIENTAVLFHSTHMHASSPPRNTVNRITLNVVMRQI